LTPLHLNYLPIVLATIPVLVRLLAAVSTLQLFDWLRNVADILLVTFFIGPALFFDWIGLIRFNVLGGTPTLFGSPWAAEVTYIASSSLVLYLVGILALKLLRVISG
jgi:membrane protein implicated in regulation of membrane protease activity